MGTIIEWIMFSMEPGDEGDLKGAVQAGINAKTKYPNEDVRVIDFTEESDRYAHTQDGYMDTSPFFVAIVVGDVSDKELMESFKEKYGYTDDEYDDTDEDYD